VARDDRARILEVFNIFDDHAAGGGVANPEQRMHFLDATDRYPTDTSGLRPDSRRRRQQSAGFPQCRNRR
jgi:hypothetical protein